MDYWLVMLPEESYRWSEERGLYGAPAKTAEFAVGNIKRGDRLVVYVVKEGCSELCQSFVAVWEVAGEWRRSRRATWPDEEREGRVKYPWVVEVRPVARGVLRIGDALEGLREFGVGSPSALRLFSYYYRRGPLPRGFGEFVERALGGAGGGGGGHELLKSALVELAGVLGFYGRVEVANGPFRHDVCWWRGEVEARRGIPPVAVFEVVAGGFVERSLAALKHAYDVWRPRGLFLVVAGEGKRERALRLLEPYLSGAFHELADKVRILSGGEVLQLHADVSRHKELLGLFATLR
ncbi:EVE domain-containing protein [Pyrobaculum sp. 3827-6]|uniref:EVE domain-containing protein n=1 Tax=Pyrobaculum sp. 3827-6 TaxID=2983604 RepID=UPI0021D9ECDF|nr:EVE domain-containing protein [Pyrobaculum sp. 3827-6]MCU7787506.1 EVE domain-containing protein [Pyrobaculum sp. 3827-6]